MFLRRCGMASINVRRGRPDDHAEWLRMRRALWDDCPDDQQVREMEEILAGDSEEVFFAERPGGGLCGFVEAAIGEPHAERPDPCTGRLRALRPTGRHRDGVAGTSIPDTFAGAILYDERSE
jgi:hypothetical protein